MPFRPANQALDLPSAVQGFVRLHFGDHAGRESSIDSLQNGDSLVMLRLVSWLTRHGLHRIIVTRASAFGKVKAACWGSFSQFERDMIRERTKLGLARARAAGRKGGGKHILSDKRQAEVFVRIRGEKTQADAARDERVSKATISRMMSKVDAKEYTAAADGPAKWLSKPHQIESCVRLAAFWFWAEILISRFFGLEPHNVRVCYLGDDSSMVTVYLRDIGSIPLFELANQVAAGDMEARAILIRSNLRLCVHIANGYQHLGMSLNDLVQEASVGLMKAAERSRPGYGTKFQFIRWVVGLGASDWSFGRLKPSEAKRSGPRKEAVGARARTRGRGFKWRAPTRSVGRRPFKPSIRGSAKRHTTLWNPDEKCFNKGFTGDQRSARVELHKTRES